MEMIRKIFEIIYHIEGYLQYTRTGHLEHFIVGSLIGGLISYVLFEKTNHRLKSIIFGISTAFLIGLMKEYIDPLFGGSKDKMDLVYTFLGSIIGAVMFLFNSIVKERLKSRKVSN